MYSYIWYAKLLAQHPAVDESIDNMDRSAITIGAFTTQLGGISRETAGDARSDVSIKDLLLPSTSLPAVKPVLSYVIDDKCDNNLKVSCKRAACLPSINYEYPPLASF